MPTPQTLVDHAGRSWELDGQIAEGGEGVVYSLAGEPGLVAKLYKQPPSSQKTDKLRQMARASSPTLRKVAAWPTALLFSKPGGPVVGFLMPRFGDHQRIYHLYHPAQRLKYFPRVSWAFLVHAARNCAAAFEEVHRADCLVGDVNESNLLVGSKATVCLIDCDSFQVRSDGHVYLCDVGVQIYTPPELQGRPFHGLVRSANHDRFGLALLIFQLLFMGRHPYAGRYLGPGDMPFEQAIAEYRFAYGRAAASLQMERPPYTLSLANLSTKLTAFFERAFGRGSEAPNARPTASEWTEELDRFRLQLRPCTVEEGHVFLPGQKECPWCAIAAAGGPNHFRGVGQVAVVFAPDLVGLAALWSRIEGIYLPLFESDSSSHLPKESLASKPMPEDLSFHRLYGRFLGANALIGLMLGLGGVVWGPLGALGIALILVFLPWWLIHEANSPRRRERRARGRAATKAQEDLAAVQRQWTVIVSEYRTQGLGLRRQLEAARSECQQFGPRYQAERGQLERNKETLARDQFLKMQFLIDYDIPKVGVGRKQVLASYGIETAFDLKVAAIQAIKGFGEALTNNLMDWKRSREAAFRFDPRSGVPEVELRAIVEKFQREQTAHFARLERGAEQLTSLVLQTRQILKGLEPELRIRTATLAQARANLEVFRK